MKDKYRFLKLLPKAAFVTALFAGTIPTSFGQMQERFYVRAGLGYAFPMLGTPGFKGVVLEDRPYWGSGVDEFSYKTTSFGEGIWWNMHAGYYFLPELGLDLGLYTGVRSTEKTIEYLYDDEPNANLRNQCKEPILLNPSLAYKVPLKRLQIVGRTGVVLPLRTKMTRVRDLVRDKTTEIWELDCHFSLGFSASLALEYKTSGPLSFFVETNAIAMSPAARKMKMKSAIYNGQQVIDDIPDRYKAIYFELDSDDMKGYAGLVADPFRVPFSHIAINLGVSLSF